MKALHGDDETFTSIVWDLSLFKLMRRPPDFRVIEIPSNLFWCCCVSRKGRVFRFLFVINGTKNDLVAATVASFTNEFCIYFTAVTCSEQASFLIVLIQQGRRFAFWRFFVWITKFCCTNCQVVSFVFKFIYHVDVFVYGYCVSIYWFPGWCIMIWGPCWIK